jgi:hypothetical protein
MLLSQLLVVAVVLSLITFTMANLFQVDKTAYIHDLTSTVVLHTAEEANALLAGYRERLKLFGRVLAEPSSTPPRIIASSVAVMLTSAVSAFGKAKVPFSSRRR